MSRADATENKKLDTVWKHMKVSRVNLSDVTWTSTYLSYIADT